MYETSNPRLPRTIRIKVFIAPRIIAISLNGNVREIRIRGSLIPGKVIVGKEIVGKEIVGKEIVGNLNLFI
jgi:hypothetical protein